MEREVPDGDTMIGYFIGCYLVGAIATAAILCDVPRLLRSSASVLMLIVLTWPVPIVAAATVLTG